MQLEWKFSSAMRLLHSDCKKIVPSFSFSQTGRGTVSACAKLSVFAVIAQSLLVRIKGLGAQWFIALNWSWETIFRIQQRHIHLRLVCMSDKATNGPADCWRIHSLMTWQFGHPHAGTELWNSMWSGVGPHSQMFLFYLEQENEFLLSDARRISPFLIIQ